MNEEPLGYSPLAEMGGRRVTAARDRFAERGWPTPREEGWRTLRVARAVQQRLLRGGEAADPEWRSLPRNGVRVRRLSDALREEGEGEGWLGELATSEVSPLVDLNMGLVTGGWVVRVEGEIEEPLEVMVDERGGIHPRLVLELAPGATATLVERHRGRGSHLLVVEAVVGSGARLTHYVVGDGEGEGQFACHGVRVGEGGEYALFFLPLRGRLLRADSAVMLAGEEAAARIEGLIVAGDREQFEHRLRVVHAAAKTVSRKRFRMVGLGKGRALFWGRAEVRPGAIGSEATQSCRSLLVGRGAEVVARPELEIECDEVRCSHGATVGKLDEIARFYLMSRGLSPEAAEALLIFAFVAEMVEEIPHSALAKEATAALGIRLPGRAVLEECDG
ncbi:MAG: SufD family Fe-S cluster assembly protein [Hydrogenophilus sp.]|nr:SufD family Fe-S cluster assembly protein [Hydrogenophilus sp.]